MTNIETTQERNERLTELACELHEKLRKTNPSIDGRLRVERIAHALGEAEERGQLMVAGGRIRLWLVAMWVALFTSVALNIWTAVQAGGH